MTFKVLGRNIDEIKEHVCARVKFLPKSVVVKRTSPKRAQKR